MIVLLVLAGLAAAQTCYEVTGSYPFYPPFCFQIAGNDYHFDGPAIPDPIVSGNTINMPGDPHVGAWGNVLIADTGNNRVIEVNPTRNPIGVAINDYDANLETTDFQAITLQIGFSQFTNAGADPDSGFWAAQPAPCNYEPDHSVNGPVWATWLQNDAYIVHGLSGGGNGVEGLLLVVVAGFDGCPDNRVRIFRIDYSACYQSIDGIDYTAGNIGLHDPSSGFNRANCSRGLWSFGSRLPGSSLGALGTHAELDHPTHATQLTYDNLYDNGGEPSQYGREDYTTNVQADDTYSANSLNSVCAEHVNDAYEGPFFADGNVRQYGDILITDQGNNRIVLVDFCSQRVEWWYGPKSGPAALNAPSMTQQLLTGNIIIADTGNHRIIEITKRGMFVSEMKLSPASRPVMVGRIEVLSSNGCECDYNGLYGCDNCFGPPCNQQYCTFRNTDFDSEMGTQLIVDSANNTLTQLEANGKVRFVYDGNFGELVSGVRVIHKDLYLLTDKAKHRVVLWDKFKSRLLWRYSDLNRPSSAVMVGEETGMSRSNYWSSFFNDWLQF